MNNESLLLETIIISTIILLLCVAVIAVIISLSHKHQAEQEVKVQELAVNYEKELRKAEIEVSESVMTSIGLELHDNICMMLTSVSYGMNILMIHDDELREQLQPYQKTLQETTDHIRIISRTLSRHFILIKTLDEMIKMIVERIYSFHGIHVDYEYDGTELNLTKDQETLIFRIFQELIQNILKHANAQNIVIHLKVRPQFSLSVLDDGNGFDLDAIVYKNGIKNITERAKLAAMSCEYFTSVGFGCKVILKPLSSS